MGKSIIWRFIIIAIILGAWGYSIFPYKDKPFYPQFETMAENKDETFTKLIAKAEDLQKENKLLTPSFAILNAAKQQQIQLNKYFTVPMQEEPANEQIIDYIRHKCQGKLKLGLDLRGGTEFIIGFDKNNLPKNRDVLDVRDQIIEILQNRINEKGVVNAEIKATGDTSISLRMPTVGEDEKHIVRKLLKQTAKLEFRIVHDKNAELVNNYNKDSENFKNPAGYERCMMEDKVDNKTVYRQLFLKIRPEPVRGEDLENARADIQQLGGFKVNLTFNTKGAKDFGNVTTKNQGKRLAIVLDGTPYSAPTINSPILGGSAEITGNFSATEANRLAIVLKCGKLPVSINIDSEFGTDPTLGRDSIKSGTLSILAGFVAVVVFMIIYYMIAGVIANLALLANILLVLGTLTIAGATVTLPGLAGIVLTIGMAVDANVIIFERIREEIQKSKSIGTCIRTGYDRAMVTILDANITTLITALILFNYGTGAIKGFAVTLSIGIIASMFTALFMTRTLLDVLVYKDMIKTLKMLQFFKKPSIDFLKKSKATKIVSIFAIIASILIVGIKGDKALSVDFTGGTALTYKYAKEIKVSQIKKALKQSGLLDVRVGYKYAANKSDKLLEIVLPQTSTNKDGFAIENVGKNLNTAFPEMKSKHVQTNSIGALIGRKFKKKALFAMVLSIIAIIIYISFRFEFKFAIAANAALLHDVLIATGIFVFTGGQLSLTVLAALLTIIGYSLNDTIVVFDRIREDLGLLEDKSYKEIINISINETLSRTILTSLTTLFVVVILFLFGGGAINDFALVMLIGVLIGTYSSIFIASPIVAFWHSKEEKTS
ncbi:MAG: protein translocase subunit SecD [Verrucomicrobiota bacterium]|nr:protein translocase subunit SecD [Verrucomicrobiota bacterium]